MLMFLLLFDTLMFYLLFFFFFNDTATTEIYTLSLHDALPICAPSSLRWSTRPRTSPPTRFRNVRLPDVIWTRRATGAETVADPPATTRSRPMVAPDPTSIMPPRTTMSCATGPFTVMLPPAAMMLPPTLPVTLMVPPPRIRSRVTLPDTLMVPPPAMTLPFTVP